MPERRVVPAIPLDESQDLLCLLAGLIIIIIITIIIILVVVVVVRILA